MYLRMHTLDFGNHSIAMRYLFRFFLLAMGVALTTFGLIYWHDRGFAIHGVFDFGNGPHPVFILVVGISMIPPAIWEIFGLELHRRQREE